MNEMLIVLLSLSVSGTLLVFVLALSKRLFKNKISKAWQYYIWLIVVARFLLPFTPEINLVGNVLQQIDNVIPQSEMLENTENNVLNLPPYSNGDYQVANQGEIQNTKETKTVRPIMQNALDIVIQNIWLIWLFVAAMLFIRKVTVYQSFVKYIKAGRVEIADMEHWERLGELVEQAGIKRAVSLYTNPLISSPLLIGFFRPCIMLPSTNISKADFDYTLLHELTHYKRRDMFYKWLVQITICIHWFNPAVRFMGREISKACELACDESVIREMSEKEKHAYGDTLIEALKIGGQYENSLASVTLTESVELLKERLDAIMSFKKKTRWGICISLLLTVVLACGFTFTGAYAATAKTESIKTEVTENNGVIAIPVNIKSIADGEYVWLGEYTLSAGDKIRYNIPTISGEHIAVGFTRSTRLTPTYFTSINNKTDGVLTVNDGFDVPANFAGKYNLFIQATLGNLENISGTIEIGKVVDTQNGTNQNSITVPVDIASAKNGDFIYLGEYTFSYGDKIHFNVSAATGNGFEVGLVSPKDDPLNRTHYTSSTKRYNGVLEINSDSIFSSPVKAGQYKLFVHATDNLTNIKGNITITKQAINLETVTLKDKTYYMITTKEQLLALAAGQLNFDKNYMLQKDIDLSGVEWTPIGTVDKPFTGSFNGNGCEIKGLTMTDPDAKIVGLFGYADGANIYNITLRDYDIATAGKNVKGKSISPILVFGLGDTRCYDNFTYPKK